MTNTRLFRRLEAIAAAAGLNFRSAATFMAAQPGFRGSLFWGGALMLLCPPVGWIIALGYRSLLLNRLIDNHSITEPRLPRSAWSCFKNGLKAVGVIYAYYLPFLCLFLLLGAGSASALEAHIGQVAVYLAVIPVFLPVMMLGVPAYYLRHYDWIQLGAGDFVILAVIFLGTTFLMPGAFMQVGLHGTYRAAFYFLEVLKGIFANIKSYLIAWLLSLIVLTGTVAALPLLPWVTFWAYLVFGFLFLNCVFLLRTAESAERLKHIRHHFEVELSK
jgi:hypothetical protein